MGRGGEKSANRKAPCQPKKKKGGVERTVIGHVEGGEAGVGVAEHGLDGVVSVDSAPASAGLPHSVEDSAYIQGIVPATQRHAGILTRAHSTAQNRACARTSPRGSGGGAEARDGGE